MAALAEYEVVGVTTNLGLLSAIAGHPAFAAAELDTGFIARHAADLLPAAQAAGSETADASDAAVWAAAALTAVRDQRAAIEAQARATGDPWSPWAAVDAWRMNGDGYQDLHFRRGDAPPVTLRTHPQPDGSFRLDLPGGPSTRRWPRTRRGRCCCSTASRGGCGWSAGARSYGHPGGAEPRRCVQEDPLAPPRDRDGRAATASRRRCRAAWRACWCGPATRWRRARRWW